MSQLQLCFRQLSRQWTAIKPLYLQSPLRPISLPIARSFARRRALPQTDEELPPLPELDTQESYDARKQIKHSKVERKREERLLRKQNPSLRGGNSPFSISELAAAMTQIAEVKDSAGMDEIASLASRVLSSNTPSSKKASRSKKPAVNLPSFSNVSESMTVDELEALMLQDDVPSDSELTPAKPKKTKKPIASKSQTPPMSVTPAPLTTDSGSDVVAQSRPSLEETVSSLGMNVRKVPGSDLYQDLSTRANESRVFFNFQLPSKKHEEEGDEDEEDRDPNEVVGRLRGGIMLTRGDLDLAESDLEEHFSRGSGKGGQAMQKTANAVNLRHLPTNTIVRCHATRSLEENRKIARKIMRQKLEEMTLGPDSTRGQLAEKIRKRKATSRRRHRKRTADSAGTDGEAEALDGSSK